MRVLIVDDHTLFREALVLLFRDFDPRTVMIGAATAEEAIAADVHYQALDLILLNPA